MKSLLGILNKIPPSSLDYSQWLSIGMALKNEGYSVSDWDNWSQSDGRYHEGECEKKWKSFNGCEQPVTAGTIIQIAKDNGIIFSGTNSNKEEFKELDWEDEISYEGIGDAEGVNIYEPKNFDPVKEITTYLETVFDPDEKVGYVTETYFDEKQNKYLPTRGCFDRTVGELIKQLNNCGGDIGAVLGDYNPKAGAWIRINPIDGHGVKDANVTDYRYVLVESDSLPLERQNALMRDLELPIVTLVYTGGKSLHALVKVDAKNREEYRKRVQYIFEVCSKKGLEIDKACKNPSRLSRLPGVERDGKKQFLIDKNIGKESFEEWKDYIESMSDNLPETENLACVWDNLPELAPPLIDGVLRQGHKMLIAGPSKAGKSYALIELCVAISEGQKWFGFNCTKGKVWYINLELDPASCMHRFKDVYTALNITPNNLNNIDILHLRGKSVPMDKLAPILIRRALKENYIAIIIDPIYKVLTGDENSADQMAHFCNQFDKICSELGCAVIYCHHHSKGSQGGKRSMDRASGSGVFARDPDALLDLTELEVTDNLLKQQEDKVTCEIAHNWLERFNKDNLLSQDDIVTANKILDIARDNLQQNSLTLMQEELKAAKEKIKTKTAWRIEGTLREFPKFQPINVWFDYPVHKIDEIGVLSDLSAYGEYDFKKNFSKKKTDKERKDDRKTSLEIAFQGAEKNGTCTLEELAESMGVAEKTVRRHIKEHGGFWIDGGKCGLKNSEKQD